MNKLKIKTSKFHNWLSTGNQLWDSVMRGHYRRCGRRRQQALPCGIPESAPEGATRRQHAIIYNMKTTNSIRLYNTAKMKDQTTSTIS